eukprot:CAMPEP_0168433930 /NCGR_PEP_ID=MMETSP0228-20121227/39650_1 /TAXON_ID=133427 /ORGANISM="Protoceratium reticulatum, Strain CCCM 535 (=CCMP 1889)" /LENGTH=37 /DNA_ID= /DNA_START= /DNA_END= /DNA_ORIENTATION=
MPSASLLLSISGKSTGNFSAAANGTWSSSSLPTADVI